MKLYDSAFSPFARKVRMVLEHKGLEFTAIDGLERSKHAELRAVNGRIEVPVLVDDGLNVVNSSDIVNYLEFRYPGRAVYPAAPGPRVKARAWERAADTLLDAILINISYWSWANRKDAMPDGLLDAARRELALVYAALERDLGPQDFVCGDLSIADIALFPHLGATKALKVGFTADRHPNIARWFDRMRALPIGAADMKRARAYVVRLGERDLERNRIFWRGDRIEWMLRQGFHDWFFREIAEQRVVWPGPALPTDAPEAVGS